MTDEVTQAAIYGRLIREAACDSDVASLSFFGYRDDGLRTGFQAGLARADGSARPSSAAVQEAIAASACPGELEVWSPGIEVLGTKVAVGGKVAEVTTRLAAGEDARATVCVRSADLEQPGRRCRSVSVTGLRSLNVSLRPPAETTRRVEVTVRFAAEANRTRRTIVVRQALLRR